MALTALRSGLRNICRHRYFLLSSRTLSINPLTEINNSLFRQTFEEGFKTKSVDLDVSYESLVSEVHTGFKPVDALSLLRKLRTFKVKHGLDVDLLMNDDRFLRICNTFEKGCESESVNSVQLVTGLRCLLELGLSPNMKVVQVVENEVLWLSRKMSMKTMCVCLYFHTRFVETDQQKNVVKELVNHINNRWLEIENASEIITILNNQSHFHEKFIAKVEDKILEFADKITLDDVILLMTTFVRHKRRPSSVLRALSYYLVQKQESLTLRQCSDLCFALGCLRFGDGNVLNKVTVDILAALEYNRNGTLISSLITSFSVLKWDHSVLLESCCEWVEKNSDLWSKRDWASLVLSLANLNYKPEKGEVLFSLALEALMPLSSEELSPNVLLDVVWALAILGRATPQHLAFVLQEPFYKTLIGDDIPNSVVNKLKLQNIDAVSRVEFPLSEIPLLHLSQLPEVPLSAADKKLRANVVEALKTFLPPPKYLAFNVQTTMGFTITGEFLVDEYGNPVPIVDYGVKGGNGKPLQPLPGNLKRIALLVWGFKDLTAKTYSFTGLSALSKRLLTKQGYVVVEVTYLEYQTLKTALQQVQYLQQKIKDKVVKTG